MSTAERDALLRVLHDLTMNKDLHWAMTEIQPLLRPLDGVNLTRDEAARTAVALRHEAGFLRSQAKPEERMGGEAVYYAAERYYLDLAERLEAAS